MVGKGLPEYHDAEGSRIRTISVTSGKGGVGKSNIVINLAIQFARLGKKVLILDADFGLANIDILLNLNPSRTIEEIFRNSLRIEDVIIEGPLGVDVIPASSGIQEMAELSLLQQKYLINELSRIQYNYDYLMIDTGAGIHSNVLRFNASVDEVIVVTNREPTALTDAYAMMKVLSGKYEVKQFSLVVNNCNEEQALRVFHVLKSVAAGHKNDFKLIYLGSLPADATLQQSILMRTPHILAFPDSKLTKAFERLARHINFGTGESAKEPAQIEALVLEYIPLVKKIAYKLTARISGAVSAEDLTQTGIIGLIEAAKRYDESRDNQFKTYAEFRIRGAMLDDLRERDWIPRTVREASAKLEKALTELRNEGLDTTSDELLCERLEIAPEELNDFLTKAKPIMLFSFDDMGVNNDENMDFTETISDESMPTPEINLFESFNKSALTEAIKQLPEKEQMVLALYYQEDMNLKEISQILDVTESRVSQIRTKAIASLKGILREQLISTEEGEK
ncbi:hypothetical protein CHS0354_006878 [Potamilus streckersoni]|uniref:Uncharacterized protein n=1 Tax=Potamilus streckersoni TaxID=2493646 RepID=A0AAE0WCT7_9BIVA|nr:hypothetical protein CHS0354_006878 [Potamilus streckersoni]